MTRVAPLLAALALALILTACTTVTPPKIVSFGASPASSVAGGNVTLSWSVTGSGSISLSIDHGVGDVSGRTSVTVAPSTTTSYSLSASNAGGTTSRKVTVTVTPAPPTITAFSASPASIAPGGSATLSWTVSGSTPLSLSIDQGVGDVTGLSSVAVTPAATTSYTLTASNSAGNATATVQVTVSGPDTQEPTVTIQNPAAGTSVGGGAVMVTGTASDNVGVVSVAYRVGSGSFQPCSGTSDFTCNVSGLSTGGNTITVQAADAAANTGSDTVSVSSAPGSEGFDIDLHFVSSISSTQRAAFDAAAARWGQIITAGLPDTPVSIPQGACGYVPNSSTISLPTAAINGTIDDLRIDVWVGTIDGSGGILGQGGPCWVRGGDSLSVYGVMMFDAADLSYLEQNNLLQLTILHEMGHVLGIGTLWNYNRALLTGAGTDNPRFVGAGADSAWHTLGGSGDVPVENCIDASGGTISNCGSGTRDSHWREAIFGNELMTGWLNPGSDPLSAMTIASLGDLGYTVDLGQADPYTLPSPVEAQSAATVRAGTFLLTSPAGEAP